MSRPFLSPGHRAANPVGAMHRGSARFAGSSAARTSIVSAPPGTVSMAVPDGSTAFQATADRSAPAGSSTTVEVIWPSVRPAASTARAWLSISTPSSVAPVQGASAITAPELGPITAVASTALPSSLPSESTAWTLKK
jgi:hypothetical protein